MGKERGGVVVMGAEIGPQPLTLKPPEIGIEWNVDMGGGGFLVEEGAEGKGVEVVLVQKGHQWGLWGGKGADIAPLVWDTVEGIGSVDG